MKKKLAQVGLDYSKETLNASVLFKDSTYDQVFPNSLAGGIQLVDWLQGLGANTFDVAFEPTGRYSDVVNAHLWSHSKCRLFQVNPEISCKYAASLDTRNKSDFKDARALARLAVERAGQLPVWQPKTQIQYEVRDVQMRMRSLVKQIVALKNQLKCGITSDLVKAEIADEVEWLEKRKASMLAYATKLIDSDERLRRDRQLLETIPGIGESTAVLLLCLIDFRSFKSSRRLSSFLGLTQRKRQSGTSVRSDNRISKKGSKYVRTGLFCPVWTAIAWNLPIRDLYNRLTSAGKRKRVAEVACLRKLLTIAWSVIRHQRDFDQDHQNPHLQLA